MEVTSVRPDTSRKKFIKLGAATVQPGGLVKISLGMYTNA